MTLFRLVRASGGGRRAGQRHLTPLIGREEEIDRVDAALEAGASTVMANCVLIVGEPGLGQIPPDRGISYETERNAAYLG